MFSQKSKIQMVGNKKKKFFSIFSFQKFLIFHICIFLKMLNVLLEHSFKESSVKWNLRKSVYWL